MTFDEYQKAAHATAIYPEEVALAYVTMGLVGEAGEIANKVKKIYRDGDSDIRAEVVASCDELIAKELGDVLWYCAELATVIGVSLSDIAETNLRKLTARKFSGTLGGSGDNR